MGDGNFHLQLRRFSKPLEKDPSLFGDSGFFAKEQTYRNYLQSFTDLSIIEPKVCSARHMESLPTLMDSTESNLQYTSRHGTER